MALHAASLISGLFLVFARRQCRQGIRQRVIFVFFGHPSPRSQSL
jgi:hypothetical protein